MRRLLLSWLSPLLVAFSLFAPAALAQPGRAPDPGTGETSEHATTALAYAVAFFMTVLVMLILCMPTRKRQAQ